MMLAQSFTDDGLVFGHSRPECVPNNESSVEDVSTRAESVDSHLDTSILQYKNILGQHAAICQARAENPREHGCDQEGIWQRHDIKRSTIPCHADRTIPRPSYSDWQILRPMITEMYKLLPARIVLAKIQSEGFYVTEKMLRQQIRKWRINNKNRRNNATRSIQNHSQSTTGNQTAVLAPSSVVTLERPFTTGADDYERTLLSSIDHLLENSWSIEAGLYEGNHLVNLLITLEHAMKLATDIQSPAAWTTLKNAGAKLKQASWSRISPRNIMYLIRIIGYWGLEQDDTTWGLRNSLKLCISSFIGEQHPITSIMGGALERQLDVESYLKIFTLANSKAQTKPLSAAEKEDMVHYARLSYIKILWYFRQYKRMEGVLSTWIPTEASDKCYKLTQLAHAKIGLRQYDEAEQLYKDALATFTALHQFIDIISGYVWSIVKQDRPNEAVDVFLNSMTTYKDAADREYDNAQRALHIEWFRNEAVTLQEVTQSEKLTPVIAKLRLESVNVRILIYEAPVSRSDQPCHGLLDDCYDIQQ